MLNLQRNDVNFLKCSQITVLPITLGFPCLFLEVWGLSHLVWKRPVSTHCSFGVYFVFLLTGTCISIVIWYNGPYPSSIVMLGWKPRYLDWILWTWFSQSYCLLDSCLSVVANVKWHMAWQAWKRKPTPAASAWLLSGLNTEWWAFHVDIDDHTPFPAGIILFSFLLRRFKKI